MWRRVSEEGVKGGEVKEEGEKVEGGRKVGGGAGGGWKVGRKEVVSVGEEGWEG